ncbi:MAG: hypothetical protein JKY71_07160 [Alphaproteobacteria bacterium]|nr:hypothetical protein [Alphaproteobacteria bacterium]
MSKKSVLNVFGYDCGDEKSYFQKLANGKLVYLPWGEGGEVYYVTDRERQLLQISQGLGVLFLVLVMVMMNILHIITYEALLIGINVVLAAHILFMYSVCRKLEPYHHELDARDKKNKIPRFAIDCLVIVLVQSVFLVVGLIHYPGSYFLWGYGIFIFSFYPAIVFYFQIRGGYIFQKKPSSSD